MVNRRCASATSTHPAHCATKPIQKTPHELPQVAPTLGQVLLDGGLRRGRNGRREHRRYLESKRFQAIQSG